MSHVGKLIISSGSLEDATPLMAFDKDTGWVRRRHDAEQRVRLRANAQGQEGPGQQHGPARPDDSAAGVGMYHVAANSAADFYLKAHALGAGTFLRARATTGAVESAGGIFQVGTSTAHATVLGANNAERLTVEPEGQVVITGSVVYRPTDITGSTYLLQATDS